ncbi:hypothetical protein HK100_000814 [Physocladia obscura]|uniref:Uncharacterized protein n=1 Tax=Physocladia obscura TaxID=109957 RepID=A0AAD5SZK0_9FUNG|nr:hypothetical protein HK100_000814 [Physocladia obscura]
MSFSWSEFLRPLFNSTSDPVVETTERAKDKERKASTLGDSVLSLSRPDGTLDGLAIADFISNSVNAGFAMTATSLFGYKLEFDVHTKGCILVTGASGRIGTHAARTLVSLGYTVFAGVASKSDGRRLRAKCAKDADLSLNTNTNTAQLIPIVLDVTDLASLRNAYEIVCATIGVDAAKENSLLVTRLAPHEREARRETVDAQERTIFPSSRTRTLSPLAASAMSFRDDEYEEIELLHGSTIPASSSSSSSSTMTSISTIISTTGSVNPSDLFIGVVNCEGTESPGALELLPLEEIMRCYQVNTAGAVAVTQCFLPLLRESKGRIINVCSSVGVTAAPINGSYAASKMALVAVSESLRVELYPFGISVSIIEPGSLDATAWAAPKKKETTAEPVHSLQLGQLSQMRQDEEQSQQKQNDRSSSRSRSRAGIRVSAPPSALGILSENKEEIPYEPPPSMTGSRRSSVTNRRGSGSVDESGKPSSPQVFPYQSGLASPPPTSPTFPSAIPMPLSGVSRDKRRSLSSLSNIHHPVPKFAGQEVNPATMAKLTSMQKRASTSVGVTPPMPQLPPMPTITTTAVTNGQSLQSPIVAYKPPSMQSIRSRRATTTDPRLEIRSHSVAATLFSPLSPTTGTTFPIIDRERIANDLYGSLINTVKEVSDSVNQRVRDQERKSRAAYIDATTTNGSIQLKSAFGGIPLSPATRDESATASNAYTNDVATAASTEPGYKAPVKPRRRIQSVGQAIPDRTAIQRGVEMGVVKPSAIAQHADVSALTSSCRHVSRAIVHSLISPFPKTRYRVGWDAKTTSLLKWALPDRFLDWGFVTLSGRGSGGGSGGAGSDTGRVKQQV